MTCPECNGSGLILTCLDDICVGSGECRHGDGEEICSHCQGEGEIGDPDDILDEDQESWEQIHDRLWSDMLGECGGLLA